VYHITLCSHHSMLAAGIYLPPGHLCRVVLASASLHFRKRIRAYATDPWVMMGPDRKLVLVVGVEEDHTEAAQDLIKLIYEHAVPGSTSALKLAKVGRLVPVCLQHLSQGGAWGCRHLSQRTRLVSANYQPWSLSCSLFEVRSI
jgi:hypothetical protein